MRISFRYEQLAPYQGYGHACRKIVNSLVKTDRQVSYADKDCDLEIAFGHPSEYDFLSKRSYKIGYTDWESSQLKSEWVERLDNVDEIWVGNNWNKEIFSKYTDKRIEVFGHGVDTVFTPQKRKYDGTLKFLHIGYPAYRKNLHDVVEAFLELYSEREDVTLTIKAYKDSPLEEYSIYPNINIIAETLTSFEMVKLMADHHCLVYPSWGEGFGLIPLQCLATGMPTIVTEGWCDYTHLLEDLVIDAKLSHNYWTVTHPGLMWKPNYNTVLEKMKYVEENIESLLEKYYNKAPLVMEQYNWDKVVDDHFTKIEQRLVLQ